ncbi:lipopolysaccharide core heptose(II) kinase RfaY [Citrobacter sp. FDAARGOS_156]|uniref:lipopolysaccharide core heptose(II) kinase RfaY n=1 Tax=Citrobacter sp. FDAARGOS_156 TaxID=1702170 RepID=UPI0019042113|nr:lipopolysaccharide core heptose(II) kinase RfaY [Citrobacter sp. FDAARGOS_156]MBJ9883947.1 lipopolysaccharide core heptose(II) kinase RfaY [Citrobacter sp. FDAARGOS_156]
MAISKTHEKGFTVYCKETRKDLKSLMNKYIKKEISGKPLSSGNALRSVELVEYNSKKFIIKNDREVDPRFEKKLQNFTSGPFYSRLIRKLDRLPPEMRICTADLYYAAEKTRFRQCHDVYTIHEYIEGVPLREINQQNADEVKQCVLRLHKAGLASNDIHPGNFIRTPTGELRIIDLSCKGNMKVCQANDILALQRKYNINVKGRGLIYKLILLKENIRSLSRKIRGK